MRSGSILCDSWPLQFDQPRFEAIRRVGDLQSPTLASNAVALRQAHAVKLVRELVTAIPATAFAELDVNCDGYLSRAELKEGLQRVALSTARWAGGIGDTAIDQIMSVADADGDGQVSIREFEALAEVIREAEALKAELQISS